MKRHWKYLIYLIRHKWFVFIAFTRMPKKSLSLFWLILIHDLSKFKPSEWFPYARTFYAPDGKSQYNENMPFTYAWNDHMKHNKHHWQYWLITWDRGESEPLPMPKKYILEMVCDWMGAGRAITGKWEEKEWYEKNKDKIIINTHTRDVLEFILLLV